MLTGMNYFEHHAAMRLYGAEPDVSLVLLDLNMADCKGLQGLRQFIEAYPQAQAGARRAAAAPPPKASNDAAPEVSCNGIA